MQNEVIRLNYLAHDLVQATHKAGDNHADTIMFHLLEIHDRAVPSDILELLSRAKGRELNTEERTQLNRLVEMHDLALDVHLAETEVLPKEPLDFMLTGVTRDFLRNLRSPSYGTGKEMASLLLETKKKEEICPKALELLEKNPSTLSKSTIAGFIWLQMAYDFRRAVDIVKAFEKVS